MVRRFTAVKTAVSAVALAGMGFSTVAFAQDTTYAKVPFRVNVDATITAIQGVDTISKDVTGKTSGADTLKLPLEISIPNAVRHTSGTQGKQNAPIVTGSRGNITLRLPTQSYNNAEVALHSVNGKRIMRGKANAKDAVNSVSRKNIAAGVYLLSVKGINSNTFTTRLTHSGGNMNINVAFGGESASHSPTRQLGKKADIEDGDWEITVSAVTGEYKDSTYTLNLTIGEVYQLQNITLIKLPPVIETFVDERDGTPYKKVTIGTQTWMAGNLNYAGDDEDNPLGLCYENSPDSCAKYGRLYDWRTAMDGASSSYANPSGVQGVCPDNWHLPSDGEWGALLEDETKLKSSTGWESYSGVPVGTDEYGFSALPGGYSPYSGGFDGIGKKGVWWSSTRDGTYFARTRIMNYDKEKTMSNFYTEDTASKLSVRCVQNVE
jgi:uncharacterized protein (TIGR02145 family)